MFVVLKFHILVEMSKKSFLPFLALTICLPIHGMASNIFIIIDTTRRLLITQIVSGSISFTYHIIPRGRKTI